MQLSRLFSFYGILKPAFPFHFYVFQAMSCIAILWLFLSWDFGALGHFDFSRFDYSRRLILMYWTGPAFFITSGQFIYEFIPNPSVSVLYALQFLVIGGAAACLFGVFPRWGARIAFVLGIHLVSFHLIANLAMDGGTSMTIASMLILSLSPKNAFYRLGKKTNWNQKSVDYRWPVFLFITLFGIYYSTAGINKLIETRSLWWGHDIRLDKFSQAAMQQSLFLSSNNLSLTVCSLLDNELVSMIIGYKTLVMEIIVIGWLWIPALRFLLPPSLAVMHVIIYLNHGYGGYLVYTFLVLACIDFDLLFSWARGGVLHRDKSTARSSTKGMSTLTS